MSYALDINFAAWFEIMRLRIPQSISTSKVANPMLRCSSI